MAKASDNVFPLVRFSEAAAPATPGSGELRLYAKTDGKLYYKNDAGTEVEVGAAAAAASETLASVSYNPATFATKDTTSTTPVDIDATNLAVTFTAPTSGNVVVELTGLCVSSTTGGQVMWTIREGTSQIGAASLVHQGNIPSNHTAKIRITGLTPGSVHTYKWAHQANSAQASLYVGGPGTGTSNTVGAAVMEVFARS